MVLVALILLNIIIPKPVLLESTDFSRVVYSKSGKLLRMSVSQDERYRVRTKIKDISPLLVDSTLLHEDNYFYWHPGINPFSLYRAIYHTYIISDRRIGASTISMQLARMRFRINTRVISGKLEQIARALQIEWHYTKDEILEAYLNLAPYGGNIEGVEAASLIYFDKSASQLTLPEALTLSVIPQHPRIRRPYKGNVNLVSARASLFAKWLVRHPLAIEYKELIAKTLPVRNKKSLPYLAPHFADNVIAANPGHDVLNTTLDLSLQNLLERQSRAYVERYRGKGIRNVSAMLVDHRDMSVHAVVGSVNFYDNTISGQVNGTLAKRSPGSTLKPFIYGLGVEQGLIHPLTMLKDAPTYFGAYNPENFDQEYVGPIKAWEALVRSRNVPAVALTTKLRKPGIYTFLKQAGISGMQSEQFYGLALVLGGLETSMEELVRLYAMLANGGALRSLRKLKNDPYEEGKHVLSPEASYVVLRMLSANPRPRQAYKNEWVRDSLSIAWKTGTSYGFRDAWTIGVFGPYVLAVWTGNFDGSGNPAFVGREAAAPLFFSIFDAIRAHEDGMEDSIQHVPEGVSEVEVCSVSGGLPTSSCRHRIKTHFIPGKSPIKYCDIHRRVYVDKRTGKQSCSSQGRYVRAEVHEYWPSDLLKLFREAGIPRRSPPAVPAECKNGNWLLVGKPPQITSPVTEATYQLKEGSEYGRLIPMSAISDADVTTLYWFLDEQYLGTAEPAKPYFWKAMVGEHIVRVVDDQGRAASRKIRVTDAN